MNHSCIQRCHQLLLGKVVIWDTFHCLNHARIKENSGPGKPAFLRYYSWSASTQISIKLIPPYSFYKTYSKSFLDIQDSLCFVLTLSWFLSPLVFKALLIHVISKIGLTDRDFLISVIDVCITTRLIGKICNRMIFCEVWNGYLLTVNTAASRDGVSSKFLGLWRFKIELFSYLVDFLDAVW